MNSGIIPRFIWGNKRQEVFFRKSFELAKNPKKAVLRIFADTGYELFLNSHFVAAVDEVVNTRDYDVTDFLFKGKNIISIKGINHGGHKGLAFELRIFNGKEVISVLSDLSWKIFSEERWGWKEVDFDDSAWGQALPVPHVEKAGALPWKGHPGDRGAIPVITGSLFMTGQVSKFVRSPFYLNPPKKQKLDRAVKSLLGDEYEASSLTHPGYSVNALSVRDLIQGAGEIKNAGNAVAFDGKFAEVSASCPYGGPSFIIDFANETAGYFRLKLESEGLIHMKLLFAESISECYCPPPDDSLLPRYVYEDVQVHAGTHEWECKRRQGFRFVKVEFMRCPSPLKVSGASARCSYYPVSYSGYFSCSDELLNTIWKVSRRTLHTCMQEYYLDGIRRDRLLWIADARVEALINYYLFGDLELFKFSWRRLADFQYPDGSLPATLGEGQSVLWDFNAWWIIAIYDYYMHSGDIKFPLEMKDYFVKTAQWILDQADPADGLVAIPDEVIPTWFYTIYWGDKGKSLKINALFARALKAADSLLKYMGSAEGLAFVEAAEKMESSIAELKKTQALNKCSGSVEAFEITEAMIEEGKRTEALDFIRENWGPQIRAGATSFWEGVGVGEVPRMDEDEHWTKFNYQSRCHGWSAGPGFSLISGAAGIRVLEPGFRRFAVKPQLGNLSFVKAAIPTPHGMIALSIEDGKLALLVPKGCVAELTLPGEAPAILKAGLHKFSLVV